ncbi:MAG TPA: hypothetical protein PKN95_02620 [Verrucomicrobiota bacterium]|nr:hypothetical protein [Verrucomicrobiota bacterium]HNT13861.1 hypothetical protein [Verrucomicrobiota bacterium]
MTTEIQPAAAKPDSAAVFACAHSLWEACHEHVANHKEFNLSDCFNGIDQFMREVMAIGKRFEEWACEHINFDELNDVWPYLLEEKFGKACLAHLLPHALLQFNQSDCLWVALHLRLPVIHDDALPIPIEQTAANPIGETGFREFRIQTVRDSIEDGDVVAFIADDDPFDEGFGERYFALYGLGEEGKLEHIADRKTYGELLALARKLAPGIAFPNRPTFGI